MRDLTALIVGALFGALLFGVWLRFDGPTKPPRAGLLCDPATAVAGEAVTCSDLSLRADRILWDFGDGLRAEGAGQVRHVYDAPGEYVVTLTAVGPGPRAAEDVRTAAVEVRPRSAVPPHGIDLLRADAADAPDVVETPHDLHALKESADAHFDGDVETYELAFAARPGFTIATTRLRITATNGMVGFRSTVDPDRKTARISVRLRGGAARDGERGFLQGTLILVEESETPGDVALISDLRIDRLGTYALPRLTLAPGEALTVRDAEGAERARGPVGSIMADLARGLGYRVEQTAAVTLLHVVDLGTPVAE